LRRTLSVAALAPLVLASVTARADDYVTVRGAYYREHSTRVIQPTITVERDSPSPSGVDVKAHFLVDAITSASLAAGTAVDSVFTETRNEAGLGIRKRWSRAEATVAYAYSAESDYWAHSLGVNALGRFWGDTARVRLSLGVSLDTVTARGRTPECATPPSTSCSLNSFFGGLSYSQVLSPVLIAQVALEGAYLDGFQGNLYRSVPNFGYERLPPTRVRNALAGRVAYHLPRSRTTLRLGYRFYIDYAPDERTKQNPWDVHSHTLELRIYQPITRTFELRGSYRQYLQSKAAFWCDPVARPGCYVPESVYYSTDPKLGAMHSEYPELQVIWRAEQLAGIPVLQWLAAGTFDISYGYFIQSTAFGNAHVLQTGYTLPY
jgi:hypothetical protein